MLECLHSDMMYEVCSFLDVPHVLQLSLDQCISCYGNSLDIQPAYSGALNMALRSAPRDRTSLNMQFWKNIYANMRAAQRLRSQWRLKFASHTFIRTDGIKPASNATPRCKAALDCRECRMTALLDSFLGMYAPVLLSGVFQARHWHPQQRAPPPPILHQPCGGSCPCFRCVTLGGGPSRGSPSWATTATVPSPIQYNRSIGEIFSSTSPFIFVNNYYAPLLELSTYKLKLHTDLLTDANAVFPVRPQPRDHESLKQLGEVSSRRAVDNYREWTAGWADNAPNSDHIRGRMGQHSAFALPVTNLTGSTRPGQGGGCGTTLPSTTASCHYIQLCPWLPVVNVRNYRCQEPAAPCGSTCLCGAFNNGVPLSSNAPTGDRDSTAPLTVNYFTARNGHFLDECVIPHMQDLVRSVASGICECPCTRDNQTSDTTTAGSMWSKLKRCCRRVARSLLDRIGKVEAADSTSGVPVTSNPPIGVASTMSPPAAVPTSCIHYFHCIIVGVDSTTPAPPTTSSSTPMGAAAALRHYRRLGLPVREVVVAVNMFEPPDVETQAVPTVTRATPVDESPLSRLVEAPSLAYTGGTDHDVDHDHASFDVISMWDNILPCPNPKPVIAKCSAISFNYKQ